MSCPGPLLIMLVKTNFFKGLDLTVINNKLDWESIRSSPRDGSSNSNGLTKGWLGFGGWLGVVGWVVGPQYFRVIP